MQAVAVCHGPRCGDYGGKALAKKLRAEGYSVEALPCQSLCPHGPIARTADQVLHRATVEALQAWQLRPEINRF